MYFKLFYAVIANCDVRSYTLGLLSAKYDTIRDAILTCARKPT